MDTIFFVINAFTVCNYILLLLESPHSKALSVIEFLPIVLQIHPKEISIK